MATTSFVNTLCNMKRFCLQAIRFLVKKVWLFLEEHNQNVMRRNTWQKIGFVLLFFFTLPLVSEAAGVFSEGSAFGSSAWSLGGTVLGSTVDCWASGLNFSCWNPGWVDVNSSLRSAEKYHCESTHSCRRTVGKRFTDTHCTKRQADNRQAHN